MKNAADETTAATKQGEADRSYLSKNKGTKLAPTLSCSDSKDYEVVASFVSVGKDIESLDEGKRGTQAAGTPLEDKDCEVVGMKEQSSATGKCVDENGCEVDCVDTAADAAGQVTKRMDYPESSGCAVKSSNFKMPDSSAVCLDSSCGTNSACLQKICYDKLSLRVPEGGEAPSQNCEAVERDLKKAVDTEKQRLAALNQNVEKEYSFTGQEDPKETYLRKATSNDMGELVLPGGDEMKDMPEGDFTATVTLVLMELDSGDLSWLQTEVKMAAPSSKVSKKVKVTLNTPVPFDGKLELSYARPADFDPAVTDLQVDVIPKSGFSDACKTSAFQGKSKATVAAGQTTWELSKAELANCLPMSGKNCGEAVLTVVTRDGNNELGRQDYEIKGQCPDNAKK